MVNSNVNALGVIFANTYDNLVPELVAERSCKYSSSLLSSPKKFSITALSRQFPFRLMLCRMPFSRSMRWYCLYWYCQP